jgi:hypothetical protein
MGYELWGDLIRAKKPNLQCATNAAADSALDLLDTASQVPSRDACAPRCRVERGLDREPEGKRLELLHELVPTTGVIALLMNPSSPFAEVETKTLYEAARTLGVELTCKFAATHLVRSWHFSYIA